MTILENKPFPREARKPGSEILARKNKYQI